MQRRARVRLRGACARVRRARAHAGGGGGGADETAFGADVFLPPGERGVSRRRPRRRSSSRSPQWRRKAHAGAGRRLGGRAGGRPVSGRGGGVEGRAALRARSQQATDPGAGAGLREDGLVGSAGSRALRPAFRQPRLPPQALCARVLPARHGFSAARSAACGGGPAARGARGLQPRRHRDHRDRRRVLGAAHPAGTRVGIHIAAPGLGFAPGRRSTPSRRSAFRPRTCPVASSPCCPTT